jgi:hypothetical protein
MITNYEQQQHWLTQIQDIHFDFDLILLATLT